MSRFAALALCILSLQLGRPALADPWEQVVDRMAPGARAVERTETRLRLAAPGLPEQLVLSVAPGEDVDIWFELRTRRGRNAYRAWYVNDELIATSRIPKRDWPRYLAVEFLRLLRARKTPPARGGALPLSPPLAP